MSVDSIIIGGSENLINGAEYSAAFGQNVTVTNSYETAFYSTSAPGVVKITHVLHLTPRNGPPSSPQEGDIYYDASTHKLMVYDGTAWRDCN